jgi:hypothetical protein
MLTRIAGPSSSDASAPLETSSTITPTSESPTSQPRMNAGPFVRARGVPSIKTTAMIGTGLSATPTASGSTSPIASAISSGRSWTG